MSDADLEAFSRALFEVGVVCGRHKLDADVVAVYFRQLRELPRASVLRAMAKFVRTAETGRRFPSPAEIRAWMPQPATSPSHWDAQAWKNYNDPAWWKRHWAEEDERTGRWRKTRFENG